MVKVMNSKIKLSVIVMLCMNLMCGCKSKKMDYHVELENLSLDYYSVKKDYDFDNAIKDGFVVYSLDKTHNEKNIEEFYDNYLNNKNDSLTIVQYTIEGDPLVIEYVYQDNKLLVYEDYTRDKYGSIKEVTVKEIKNIELQKDENGRISIVEKCL